MSRYVRLAKRRKKLYHVLETAEIFSPRSLYEVSRECRKHVNWKGSVQRWCLYGWLNSVKLSQKVLSEEYRPKKNKTFVLHERGKARIICPVSFQDRVVEHTLCEKALLPLLSPEMSYDNAASRRGKGTEFARERFKDAISTTARRYPEAAILVFDYHDYFGSIPTSRVLRAISNKLDAIAETEDDYKAANFLIRLLSLFLNGIGLDIGNQTSQVIAIWWATPIDRWLNKVAIKSGRYMDDGWALFPNKGSALEDMNELNSRSAGLGLTINTRKTNVLLLCGDKIPYLKGVYTVSNTGKVVCHISSSTIRRWRRHVRHLSRKVKNGSAREDDLKLCLASAPSIMKRCDSQSKRRIAWKFQYPDVNPRHTQNS
jgi:RNA-directed DNA polymerase